MLNDQMYDLIDPNVNTRLINYLGLQVINGRKWLGLETLDT